MKMMIDGVEITSNLADFTEDEARKYIAYVNSRIKGQLLNIEVKLCDDGKIDVDYTERNKFERIRRITGSSGVAVCC